MGFRTEDALFRALVECVADQAIFMAEPAGRITHWNSGAQELYRHRPEQALDQPFTLFFSPEDLQLERPQHALKSAVASGRCELECWQIRGDGTRFIARLQFKALHGENGELDGIAVIATDLTRRNMDEELNGFFLLPLDLLCIAGFDGYFKRVNKTWERTLGYSQQDLLAAPFMDFVHPDDREATAGEYERQMRGHDVMSFENRYRCKDGSYRWLHWSATQVLEKKIIYASARDISGRKIVEEQQRQAQKMEAIGRLAGGVAHDFNNMLTVIIGRAQLSALRIPDADPMRRDLKLIEETAGRAAALTRQLLQFSRQQLAQPRVVNLNALITQMEEMLRRLVGEHINLQTRLSPKLNSVKIDPGQFQQVVMNLAVNARDAMERGGSLVIETNNLDLDDEYARYHAAVHPGPHVMLAVSDTGPGMDEKTRSHLFEPFFTTKSLGKGTGLGLSTVYGAVKQAGGHIWVYSEPGAGTTFKVYFPSVSQPPAKISTSQLPRVEHGHATILLVEDEAEVRELVRDVLTDQGYILLVAENGEEALSLSARHSGVIDLLITDVVMPRLSGGEVTRRLKAERPALRVLYITGYTSNAVVHHGIAEEGIALLEKPFTPSALVQKVREVLAQS